VERVGVGIIGSGFVSEIHAKSLDRLPNAELVAVASQTPQNVQDFAQRHDVAEYSCNYEDLLEIEQVDMVLICVPNYLHSRICCDAAQAGKHVVCEKPLCTTMAEAQQMVETCEECGVHLMYGEQLCFVPKYVRAKQICDAGGLGELYRIKQCEKHDGPHSEWFWDVELSGGGVTLDMGCHAFEYFRWMLGKPAVKSVWADMDVFVHQERTRGDDDALIMVEFEGGARGVAEVSWAKPGGMDDCAQIYGSEGVIHCDLLYGSAFRTYSKRGYDYAVEKAGDTQGWTFTMYEEAWNYGYPQEMQHFVDCVLGQAEPLETGRDGLQVMKMVCAAYESAGTGSRIQFPYQPPDDMTPFELWGQG
jgi:myo-inositol 2-dehydrogenase/D-chiro-inositol 1-dehydrogenase